MNKVILTGRISTDLELRYTPNNVAVLSFPLAVQRSAKDKDGNKKTDFFKIVCFKNTAEYLTKWRCKGDKILVEGELQNRSYKDKDNVTKYVSEVLAHHTEFVSSVSKVSDPKEETQIDYELEESYDLPD